MGSLVKFEFRKIYKKRMNMVVSCITIFLIAVFGIANITQSYTYNEKGEKVSGKLYVKYMKQIAKTSGGELTNEKAQDILAEYQHMVATPGYYEGEGEDGHFTDEIYCSYFLPHRQILLDIAHVYDDPGVQTWGSNLDKLSLNDIKPLYEAKKDRFQMILEAGSGDWNYTTAEKQYWTKQYDKIAEPVTYGYAEGWSTWFEMAGFFFYVLVGIFIIMSTVYAGEYEQKADHIILTTRYGKSKVIVAKNVAAFLYGFLLSTACILIMALICFGWYGVEGASLPVQSIYFQSVYPLTNVQAVLLYAIMYYLVSFMMIAMTLWLSARMKNGLSVLAVMLLFAFVPIFMNESVTNGLYNHILALLPYNAIQDGGYNGILSYPLGFCVLNYMNMRIVVYLILTVVVVPFAGRAFRRHEVQ